LSLRAITVVFVFSRASIFNMRTSSFVHARSFVVFFAILFPLHQCRQRISDHHNAKRSSMWTTTHSNIPPDNALPVCRVSGIESSKQRTHAAAFRRAALAYVALLFAGRYSAIDAAWTDHEIPTRRILMPKASPRRSNGSAYF
jgi:hypothetical protein